MLTKTVDRCGLSSEASYELRLERSKMPETARATRFATDADDGADEVVPPTFLPNARLSWEPAGRSPMVDLGCDLGPGLHGEDGYVSCYSPVRPSRNDGVSMADIADAVGATAPALCRRSNHERMHLYQGGVR